MGTSLLNLGKAFATAFVALALMLPQAHGNPEDAPQDAHAACADAPCCMPERGPLADHVPEPVQAQSCCATHESDANANAPADATQAPQPAGHDGQQPAEAPAPQDEDCPPCDCPCCVKTVMIAPMITPAATAAPVFFSDPHLVLLPVVDQPDAVALGVAVQPPIA